jgi:hypothetical protein
MSLQPLPRPAAVLASALAAGLVLAGAGCGHIAPLGPAASPPRPHQLRSPIVMQAMDVQAPTPPSGGCPAGFTKLSAPGQDFACYRPLGAPVIFTSAAVAPGPTVGPASPSNAPPTGYELLIAVPAADRAELTAVTTQAYNVQGAVDVSVAGKVWALPMAMAPLTQGQFVITLPSRNDANQLQQILVPSG